jgi:hypothetical protein
VPPEKLRGGACEIAGGALCPMRQEACPHDPKSSLDELEKLRVKIRADST